MKLARLEAAGFRGVRNVIDTPIANGFVIVCGRNGSGKSTLFDAIEFGFTGCISRPAMASEDGEDINDYIWWRGSGDVRDRYVRLTLLDGNGKTFVITRRPTGVAVERVSLSGENEQLDLEAIGHILSSEGAPKEGLLARLCATTIIRDEQITELSVDAPERERFSLVRDTLGSSQLPAVEKCAKGAKQVLDSRIGALASDYQRGRAEVNRLLSKISETRSAFEAEPDAEQARKDLTAVMGESGVLDPE